MAAAKQIAWRKKFAKMAKSGKFKKSKKSNPHVKSVKSASVKKRIARLEEDLKTLIPYSKMRHGYHQLVRDKQKELKELKD